MVSNGFLSDKKEENNKLIFYNICSTLQNQIEVNYTFNLTINSLCLLEYTKKNNIILKVLLCACKKYKKNQNNGIYLVSYDCKTKEEKIVGFKKTGNFEVYCFCQIYNKMDKNKIIDEGKIDNIKGKTNYFLVGGFDVSKHKGIIKLYKLKYNKKKQRVNIEYIEDIKDSQFGNIRGPISCIIQSKKNGEILVTTWDKNIFSFKSPNINDDSLKKLKDIDKKNYS